MAMDPKIKTRWTGKLREEGRTQTRSMLRDASGAQCCLDVLCEVAVDDQVIDPPVLQNDGQKFGYPVPSIVGNGMYSQAEVLPGSVRDWAGLDSADPQIVDDCGLTRCASWYNDTKGLTFSEIADLIDADETL